MKLAEFREISKEIIELRALEKSIDPNVLILNDEVQLIIEGRYWGCNPKTAESLTFCIC
jgi:hypothetical protein